MLQTTEPMTLNNNRNIKKILSERKEVVYRKELVFIKSIRVPQIHCLVQSQ